MQLKFARGNAKLDKLEAKTGRKVYSFSILSGHSCPYAKDCASYVDRLENGRLKLHDGPHTQFRCFSASQEALFKPVYNSRLHNMGLVELAAKSVYDAADCIVQNIPRNAGIIRIHVGGDLKTKAYMHAWIMAATKRQDLIFYAYTKSLPFWVALNHLIPDNLLMTASYGGYKDELIESCGLRYSKVVYSGYAARKLHLPIDHDDSHAALPKYRNQSFALLVHGMQPAGSAAGKAVRRLSGKGSYHRE